MSSYFDLTCHHALKTYDTGPIDAAADAKLTTGEMSHKSDTVFHTGERDGAICFENHDSSGHPTEEGYKSGTCAYGLSNAPVGGYNPPDWGTTHGDYVDR